MKQFLVEVSAKPEKGFRRGGRYWPRDLTQATVAEDLLAVLQAEAQLRVKVLGEVTEKGEVQPTQEVQAENEFHLDISSLSLKDQLQLAVQLAALGLVTIITPEKPLPRNFPARTVLEAAGITTFEGLAAYADADLEKLAGLEPEKLEKIRKARDAYADKQAEATQDNTPDTTQGTQNSPEPS